MAIANSRMVSESTDTSSSSRRALANASSETFARSAVLMTCRRRRPVEDVCMSKRQPLRPLSRTRQNPALQRSHEPGKIPLPVFLRGGGGLKIERRPELGDQATTFVQEIARQ